MNRLTVAATMLAAALSVTLGAQKITPLKTGELLAAKVIKAGTLTKAVKLTGIAVTKGARAAIEAAGGSVA